MNIKEARKVDNINQAIRSILTKLLKSDNNVIITLLTDRTGLTLARVSRLMVAETMGQAELESIGAIASAVFTGAAEQGAVLSLGKLNIMVAEFRDGRVLTAEAGQGILVVVAERDVQLGLIRVKMQDAAKELAALSESIAKTVTVAPEKTASAKSLISALEELENF